MVSLTCTALLDIQKMAFEKERRELLEAAEFESRVAAKLAEIAGLIAGELDCDRICPVRQCHVYNEKQCSFILLKHARLAVEEEMDELYV